MHFLLDYGLHSNKYNSSTIATCKTNEPLETLTPVPSPVATGEGWRGSAGVRASCRLNRSENGYKNCIFTRHKLNAECKLTTIWLSSAASVRKRIVGCFRSQLLQIALPQPSFLCSNEKYVINRCHPNDMLCLSKTMPRIIDAKRISPMKIVI